MNTTAVLYWSEQELPAEFRDETQLDTRLDIIAACCPPEAPTIVELRIHQHSVMIGLGLPESFVQVMPESGSPPYLVTVGDTTAEGVAAFFFMGWHHTEIRRRHLVSSIMVREVVREFFKTGQRSAQVEWEEL